MPNYTDTLHLKLTDMANDGDELFDFDSDLNENFEIIDDVIGALISKSESAGVPTSICTAMRENRNGNSVRLNWKDPNDTVIDGQYICSWAKTIIVRKKDSVPANETDGDVIVVNTIRNNYDLTPFEDTLPDSGDYYYRAFPVSVNGVVNYDPQNRFGEKIFEFIINPNDSNPDTAVKYLGENANYKPARMNFTTGQFDYGDWEKAFFMSLFTPVMLNPDGTIKEYLHPDDYSMQADGVTASSVGDTSQTANAMVRIGQIWISEENLNGMHHIKIANKQVDETFECYTHIKNDGTYRDYIYRSIYDGCNISNKIRSLSGQAICKTVAGNTQISYAKANGAGWDVDEYNVRRLINYLLILIGRSLNTQTTFGTGRYSGGSANSNNQLNTGTLDKKGMFYGDNNNGAVKVFHIENWWGNIWKITNGLLQSGGKLYYKMCEGTHDGSTVVGYQQTSVAGYIDSGVTNAGTVSECYQRDMVLVPGLGLVPKSTGGGSSSTYFGDGLWSNSSVLGFARFGSNPYDGLLVGAFALTLHDAVSYSHWTYGVSLSYKSS